MNAGGNHKNGMETLGAQSDKWFPHPNYKDSQGTKDQRYDISLLKLDSKFTRQRTDGGVYVINTICLPDKDNRVEEADNATVFGFGIINALRKVPDRLQKAEIEIVKTRYCYGSLVLCGKFKGNEPRTCSVSDNSLIIRHQT